MKGSLRKVSCKVFGRHVRLLTAVAALVWIRRRAAAPGRTEPTLPTVVLRRGREYLLSPLLYDASVERVFHSDPNSSPLLTSKLFCFVLKFWTIGLIDSFASRCMADRMQAIWSRYSALGTTPIGTQNMLLHMSGLRSAWLRAGTKPRHTSESIYLYLVGLFYLYKIVSVFVARSGKPLRQWEFTIPTRCTEWELGPYCIFFEAPSPSRALRRDPYGMNQIESRIRGIGL